MMLISFVTVSVSFSPCISFVVYLKKMHARIFCESGLLGENYILVYYLHLYS